MHTTQVAELMPLVHLSCLRKWPAPRLQTFIVLHTTGTYGFATVLHSNPLPCSKPEQASQQGS